MSPESRSALSVQYDLRPAKQVERRMLVDAFQRLAQAGFPIRDYKYTGFGSIYFYDFLLFHKILGINNMLSVEHDTDIESRVKFNCPFDCIDIKMKSMADIIPTLSKDDKQILWLDYDSHVTSSILYDIKLAGAQLSTGSLLLVTVDIEAIEEFEDVKIIKEYFENEAKIYLGLLKDEQYRVSKLNEISKVVIENALKDGMAGRDATYYPLFYFCYADGHKMLTIGGMIGTKSDGRLLKSVNVDGAPYFRMHKRSKAYEIVVPILTKKERYMLDSGMPCKARWKPKDVVFPKGCIKNYREVYRYLPAYAELLI